VDNQPTCPPIITFIMKSFYKIFFISLLQLTSIWFLPTQAALAGVVASQVISDTVSDPGTEANAQEDGPRILQSDDNGLLLEFYTSDYEVTTRSSASGNSVTPCQQIDLPGYNQTGVNGQPQLPQMATLLGVPSNVEITLSVESLTYWHTPDKMFPCPGPEGITLIDDTDIPRYIEQDAAPDRAIYDKDEVYPANSVTLDELGYIRSQRIVRLLFSPFQVNPVTGQLTQHRRVQVSLQFHKLGETRSHEDQPTGFVTESVVGLVDEPPTYESLLADTLLNYDAARKWRAVADSPPQQLSSGGSIQAADRSSQDEDPVITWSPPDSAYRIATQGEGIYAITYDELASANFPLGDSDNSINPSNFRLLYEGAPFRDKYTRTNIYWLTYDPTIAGQRMAERGSSTAATATEVEHYFARYKFEENANYLSAIPEEPGYEHWYGSRLTVAGPGNASNEEISMILENMPDDLRDVNAELPDATVMASVVANIDGQHHVKVYINDKEVYDGSWEGRTYHEVEVDFPANYLREGRNEVRVKLINDLDDRSFDMIYIDRAELRYPRKLVAQGEQFSFTNTDYGSWRYSLTGFAENAQLYDVTDPAQVSRIAATLSGNILTFTDSRPDQRNYLALMPEQDFLTAIKPLVDYRAYQGHRVKLVDVQNIYDQFNYGRLSAESIREFLIYAYENWPGTAPTYVLLVGDGTYDPIGYLDNSYPTYIPPYLEMVDPTLGETAVDHRYVTIVGDDLLADMHIGRFPVQSAEQTTAIVDKTIYYETQEITTPWNQELLFVADNLVGGGGSFYRLSNEVADGYVDPENEDTLLIPDIYTKDKIYVGQDCLDESPATECQQQILDQINEGTLMVSYVGHATKQFWAEEQLLNLSALDQLENKDNLAIMLPMACLEGYFHEAESGIDTLSESIVRMADHGAVASWAPTGFGLATGHDYLERGFMEAVFHKDITEMGPATDYGKFYLVANGPARKYDDLLDTFMVIGDPALRVRVAGSAPSERMQTSPDTDPDEKLDPGAGSFDNSMQIYLPIVLR